jgi:hypothetical protein
MSLLDVVNLLATLVFVGGSAVVSGRLLRLAQRTRDLPAFLLGGSIGGTAVLGYGVLITAMIVNGSAPRQTGPTALAVALTALGRTLHDLGVTLHIAFVLTVFRPGVGWARALAGAMVTLLWVGMVGGALDGSFRTNAVGTPAWFAEYAVIWTYPLWSMAEAYRYAVLMRRRAALGLGSPLVANRFVLWGTGSLFAVLATWIASIPFLYMADAQALTAVTPAVRVATAAAGLVSVSCSLFAFLPPAWYRRWIEARAARGAQAGTSTS